jgi:hypothetical protein
MSAFSSQLRRNVVARDTAGNASAPVRVTFKVKRPR